MHSHGLLKTLLLGTSVFAITLSPMIAVAKPHSGKHHHTSTTQHQSKEIVLDGKAAMMDTDHIEILDTLGFHLVSETPSTVNTFQSGSIGINALTPAEVSSHAINVFDASGNVDPTKLHNLGAMALTNPLTYIAPAIHIRTDLGPISGGPTFTDALSSGASSSDILFGNYYGQARGAREISEIIRFVGHNIERGGTIADAITDFKNAFERKDGYKTDMMAATTPTSDQMDSDGNILYHDGGMRVLIRYGLLVDSTAPNDPMAPDYYDDFFRTATPAQITKLENALKNTFAAGPILHKFNFGTTAATSALGITVNDATGQVFKADGSTPITRDQVYELNKYVASLAPLWEDNPADPKIDAIVTQINALTGATKTKSDLANQFTFNTPGTGAPADLIDPNADLRLEMKDQVGLQEFTKADGTKGIKIMALDASGNPSKTGATYNMKSLGVKQAKDLEIQYKYKKATQAKYEHARHQLKNYDNQINLALANINSAVQEAKDLLGPGGQASPLFGVMPGGSTTNLDLTGLQDDLNDFLSSTSVIRDRAHKTHTYGEIVTKLKDLQSKIAKQESKILSALDTHAPHARSMTPPTTGITTGTPSHRAAPVSTHPYASQSPTWGSGTDLGPDSMGATVTGPGSIPGLTIGGNFGQNTMYFTTILQFGSGVGLDSARMSPITLTRVSIERLKHFLTLALNTLTTLTAGGGASTIAAAQAEYKTALKEYNDALLQIKALRTMHKGTGPATSGTITVGSTTAATTTYSAYSYVPKIGRYLQQISSELITINRYLLQRRAENNYGLWLSGDIPLRDMYVRIDNVYNEEDTHVDFGIGIDKKLNDQFDAGLYMSVVANKGDISAFGTKQNNTALILGAYGTYHYSDKIYVSDKFAYNRSKFENTSYVGAVVKEEVESDSFNNELAIGYRVTPNFVVEGFHNLIYASDTSFSAREITPTRSGMFNGDGTIKRVFNNAIGIRHYASSTNSLLSDDNDNSLRPYSKSFWMYNISGREVKGKYKETGDTVWHNADFEDLNKHVLGAGAGLIWKNKNTPEFTGTIGYAVQYVSTYTSHVVTGALSWDL